MTAATSAHEARRTALILAIAQAIIGSAAPIAISVGGLAGHYLLGADKSLATAAGEWVYSWRGARSAAGGGNYQGYRPEEWLSARYVRHRARRLRCDTGAFPRRVLAVRAQRTDFGNRRRFRAAVPLCRGRQRAAGVQGARDLLRAGRRRHHRHRRAPDRDLHRQSFPAGDVCRRLCLDRCACRHRRDRSGVPARRAGWFIGCRRSWRTGAAAAGDRQPAALFGRAWLRRRLVCADELCHDRRAARHGGLWFFDR